MTTDNIIVIIVVFVFVYTMVVLMQVRLLTSYVITHPESMFWRKLSPSS